MSFDPRGSVFRITKHDNPREFGTGFVIHMTTGAPEKHEAYILTCAHVVVDLGEMTMTVDGNSAQLITRGDKDGLDLAVIKVIFPDVVLLRSIGSTARGELKDLVEVHGFLGEKRVPLRARLNKDEDLPKAGELRLYQFVLEKDETIEPDNLVKGYSGSPIVLMEF